MTERMIERVARAMCAHDGLDYEGMSDSVKAFLQSRARAGIKAMREPTEEMVYAAADAPQQDVRSYDVRCGWVYMIDEALR